MSAKLLESELDAAIADRLPVPDTTTEAVGLAEMPAPRWTPMPAIFGPYRVSLLQRLRRFWRRHVVDHRVWE